MAAADIEEIRATSYVGFDTITQQIEHKLLKRGFQFNVIVCGAWSLGPAGLFPFSVRFGGAEWLLCGRL